MKLEKKVKQAPMISLLVFATLAMVTLVIPAKASAATLSPAEAEMLTLMREEEKLAHDVYLVMYEKWTAVIFANILASEQRHMDTMLKMVTKYGLPDPAAGMGVGKFKDQDIQALYDALIEQGNLSFIDALRVGVAIENTDIFDLQDALAGTVRRDLRAAYTNLLDGSLSHLEAFETELSAQGQ